MCPSPESNPHPYTKRIACRLIGTPALQSDPVGPASCTPREDACRFLADSRMAIPFAHTTNARRRFCQTLDRNRPAPHLNLSPRPIAMSHRIPSYMESRQLWTRDVIAQRLPFSFTYLKEVTAIIAVLAFLF